MTYLISASRCWKITEPVLQRLPFGRIRPGDSGRKGVSVSGVVCCGWFTCRAAFRLSFLHRSAWMWPHASPCLSPPNEHCTFSLMAYAAFQLSLLQCTSLRRIDLSDNPLESPPLDCIVRGGGWSYVKTFLQKIQDAGTEGGKLLLDSMHFSLLPSMVGP